MITEDYVSFEVAKLLKEKGFDEPCHALYHDGEDKIFFGLDADSYHNSTLNIDCYACPTLQMVMKWLREKYSIFFNVNYFHTDVGNKWACLTIWLLYKNGCELSIEGFDIETVYEKAIKYCLEFLI